LWLEYASFPLLDILSELGKIPSVMIWESRLGHDLVEGAYFFSLLPVFFSSSNKDNQMSNSTLYYSVVSNTKCTEYSKEDSDCESKDAFSTES
jgi:hypothetical protein